VGVYQYDCVPDTRSEQLGLLLSSRGSYKPRSWLVRISQTLPRSWCLPGDLICVEMNRRSVNESVVT
jgi:hypothetical protein